MSYKTDYERGYQAGYRTGVRSGIKRARMESVAKTPKVQVEEKGDGYTCVTCEVQRPRNWFVYEIKQEEHWVGPCCAMCARSREARGPFPQGQVTRRVGHHE